jgi:hypothetical protein
MGDDQRVVRDDRIIGTLDRIVTSYRDGVTCDDRCVGTLGFVSVMRRGSRLPPKLTDCWRKPTCSTVAALAEETVRATALVEEFNSRLRSDFFLRRRLGSDYLALLQFYRNDRWLERSDRPRACGEDPRRAVDRPSLPALAGDARLQALCPRLRESPGDRPLRTLSVKARR